jgi:outer membrane protein
MSVIALERRHQLDALRSGPDPRGVISMGLLVNQMNTKRMIRSTLVGFVIAAGLMRPALAEEAKLGYVDLRRALHETDDGRKAETSLKKIFDQKQKELDEQQEDVKKAIEDLNKKRTLLPADTVRQKDAELQERVAKVQQTYMRHQQDLATREEEATRPIVERLQRIVNKIAADENFTMILQREAIAFAKPHLDLTNEVIRRYNAGEEKASASAGSKSAPSKKK